MAEEPTAAILHKCDNCGQVGPVAWACAGSFYCGRCITISPAEETLMAESKTDRAQRKLEGLGNDLGEAMSYFGGATVAWALENAKLYRGLLSSGRAEVAKVAAKLDAALAILDEKDTVKDGD